MAKADLPDELWRSLTKDQKERYIRLWELLASEPELRTSEMDREARGRRLLRWLKAEQFDPQGAADALRNHARWWIQYGMANFSINDELDESGPMFVCGVDLYERPVLVARPSAFRSGSCTESIQIARRCVYTVQRWIERMPLGEEEGVLLYDAHGLRPRHVDPTFLRELMSALNRHFPNRLAKILVLNNHWTMSALWAAMSVWLHSETKEKICFLGSDFEDKCLEFVSSTHPYLEYSIEAKKRGHAKVAPPRRLPYKFSWCDLPVVQGETRSPRFTQTTDTTCDPWVTLQPNRKKADECSATVSTDNAEQDETSFSLSL